MIGIITRFGRKKNRDAIRRAWMSTGRIPFFFVSLKTLFILLCNTQISFQCVVSLRLLMGVESNRTDTYLNEYVYSSE